MPAYLIVMREEPIRDQDAMAEYKRKTREKPSTVAAKPLVVYGAIAGLEGAAPDGVVMLQFDSVEQAQAWYGSPGYQAAMPHRIRAANHRAFIVEGL